MHEEKKFRPGSGWKPLTILLGLFAGSVTLFVSTLASSSSIGGVLTGAGVIAAIAMFATSFIALFGLLAIAPNEARVLLLFGEYKGTVVDSGFFWVNPFYSKKRI